MNVWRSLLANNTHGRWTSSVGALALLLQRTPVARCLECLPRVAIPRFAQVAKFTASATVVFGGVHAATGATTEVAPILGSANPAKGTVGQPFAWNFDTKGETAKAYTFGGSLPPGITWIGKITSGVSGLRGTPSVAGSYEVQITGWRYSPASGDKTPAYKLAILIEEGTGAAPGPKITTQPLGGEFLIDSPISLKILVEGTRPRYQWRKDGEDLVGATGAELKIGKAKLADAGSYLAVVSTSLGTVTSATAVVEVVGGYQPWRVRHWTGADSANDTISGPLADPDEDGTANLLEFVFDRDPHVAEAGNLPRARFITEEGQIFYEVSIPVNPEASTVELAFEKSSTLAGDSWRPLVDGEEGVSVSTTPGAFTARVPVDQAKLFLRLAGLLKPAL